MANGLRLADIGGGLKALDTRGVSSGGPGISGALQLQNQLLNLQLAPLRAQQLANQLQLQQEELRTAPSRRRREQIETQLKENELANIEVDNLQKLSQLNASMRDEIRSQAKFVTDQIKELPALFQQNPQLGQFVLQQAIPGASASLNANGTFDINVPDSDTAFTIDPNKIAKPDERLRFEQGYRKEFQQTTNDFKEISRGFRNIRESANLATAQGDLSMIIGYAKMLDPGSVVREGEVEVVKRTPGLPEQVVNMYERALTANAPIFGEKNSTTRQKFLQAAKTVFQQAETDVLQDGQFFYEMTDRAGLNPLNVVRSVGNVTVEEFIPADRLTDAQLKKALEAKRARQ